MDGTDAHPVAAMASLRRIIRYLRVADREIENSSGLSSAQLFVLTTLADTPALSLAEIASRAFTDQSSVSTVVAKLVKNGLIVRKLSRTDRRRAELRLTPAGKRVLDDAPNTPQQRLIDGIRAMPPARRAELVRSLQGLVDALGADATAPKLLFDDEPKRRAK
jgi:DNA-binding MarR family transcriptional regulator